MPFFDQWVTQACNRDVHEYVHLSDTIVRLKAFNAKRKWRAVAAVVMLGARLGVKKRNRSASKGDQAQHGCTLPSSVEIYAIQHNFSCGSVLVHNFVHHRFHPSFEPPPPCTLRDVDPLSHDFDVFLLFLLTAHLFCLPMCFKSVAKNGERYNAIAILAFVFVVSSREPSFLLLPPPPAVVCDP